MKTYGIWVMLASIATTLARSTPAVIPRGLPLPEDGVWRDSRPSIEQRKLSAGTILRNRDASNPTEDEKYWLTVCPLDKRAPSLPPSGQPVCTGSDSSSYVAELVYNSCISEKAVEPVFPSVTVDLYFHVVQGRFSDKSVNVTPESLDKQLKQLNEDFRESHISFNLKDTRWYNRTALAAGYLLRSTQAREFHEETRKGAWTTLNVYIFPSAEGSDSLAGVTIELCTSIEDAQVDKSRLLDDVVLISSWTLPGGPPPTQLGRTLTHEVGHWLNLPHPQLDEVCRAAPEMNNPFSWSHTFMHYCDDATYVRFNAQQKQVMHDAWTKRAELASESAKQHGRN